VAMTGRILAIDWRYS